MTELAFLLLVVLIGIITGFLDSTLASGGLFSVPMLMVMGLPAHTAIATDRFGTLGQTMTAIWKYWKAKKIIWKYVLPLSILSAMGSFIGASLLVQIDSGILQRTIGILLLILLPFIFVRKEIGIKKIATTHKKKVIGFVLYFFVMIYAGFFGQGTGLLLFYPLIYFLGFTMIEVAATCIIPWFVLSVISLIIFAVYGIIDYKIGAFLLMGMAIGGYLGAHFAIVKGNVWIKRLFILFVIAAAIKLLLFD